MKFKIIIKKDGDGFRGYIPKLKGLHVQGDTTEETLLNAGDALSAYMESIIKHKETIEEIIEEKKFEEGFEKFNKTGRISVIDSFKMIFSRRDFGKIAAKVHIKKSKEKKKRRE